ncbi:protein translocase subunit SecF, partial [bacterium]|nr:protein translocase subunit SecF [bacterium]
MQIFQEVNIDFIGKRNTAILLSFALIAIGIASVLFHSGLNYGIDFAGGTLVQIQFNSSVNT